MNDTSNDPTRAPLRAAIRELCRPRAPSPTGVPPRLRPMPGIKAVLFDIYGTLLTCGQGDVGAAEGGKAEALLAALEAAVPRVIDAAVGSHGSQRLDQEIARRHARQRKQGVEHPEVEIRNVWRTVLGGLRDEGLIIWRDDPRTVERLAVEYECRANPAWPMPGADRTLNGLSRAEFRLGIASNAQFYTPLILDVFHDTGFPLNVFDPALCAWSYQRLEAKPSPRLIAAGLRVLHDRDGITAADTLYVGNDMLNDIASAQQLGCVTALFAGDRRSLRLRDGDARVAGITPDLVVTELTQLLDVLG